MDKGLSLSRVLTDDASAVALTSDDVTKIVAAGARVVRMELRLGAAHLTWDATILGLYRQVATQLTSAGLRVIALLDPALVAGATQDAWNANNTENNAGATPTNAFIDAYVHAAATVALALGDEVAEYELWNEPNSYKSRSGTVYTGNTYIYPSLCATLLQRTGGLLTLLWPACRVTTGGLYGHDIGGVLSATNSGATYFSAVCAQLQARGAGVTVPWPFGAVGQHLYLDQGGATDPAHITRYLDYLAAVLTTYGLTALPICVTEAAWTTHYVTPDVQASNLSALYQACAAHSGVAAVLWFLLHDVSGSGLLYGLCTDEPALTPKPALAAFQAV